MKIGFQSLQSRALDTDSVSTVAGRSTRRSPVAAVRRRRPCLSAPTRPLGRHDAPPSDSRPPFPLQRSPFSPLSSLASSAVSQGPRPSSPPCLRPSQPAKSFTRASSTLTSSPLPLPSTGKAALSSSERLIPHRSSAMLTGNVARPLYSTISFHFCS